MFVETPENMLLQEIVLPSGHCHNSSYSLSFTSQLEAELEGLPEGDGGDIITVIRYEV